MQRWEEEEKGPGEARGSTSQGMRGIIKSFKPWLRKSYELSREKQRSGAQERERKWNRFSNGRGELRNQSSGK